MITFKILKRSKKSNARLGVLKTPHGEVETPAFVPVATQATVKTLNSEEVPLTGTQLLIANTFHLHLKPGEHIVKKHRGLHNFMNWQGPLMTDSAGFQVFSLGFGRDHGVGKILRDPNINTISPGQKPKNVTITQDGVWFRSPVDGKKLFIGPKESIRIQEQLGADIIFAFDECTSPLSDYGYNKKALEKTHAWARICLQTKKSSQALYGIVQGGKFKDLRKESAQYIGSLPFDGFGIGGEFGDSKKTMIQMLRWTLKNLPLEKPKHLLGIGHLEDIPLVIQEGADTFDCIVPTHYARHGYAFINQRSKIKNQNDKFKFKKIDLNKKSMLKELEPLDSMCDCFVCRNYTRSYLSHLMRAKEITALRLLTFHNLHLFNRYVSMLRSQIKKGVL